VCTNQNPFLCDLLENFATTWLGRSLIFWIGEVKKITLTSQLDDSLSLQMQ